MAHQNRRERLLDIECCGAYPEHLALMDDCRIDAKALAICTIHREALGPDRQEQELASIGALIKGFYDASAACGKRGRGEGGSAVARRSGLEPVSVLESPSLWMCEEHAGHTSDPSLGNAALLELITDHVHQWECKLEDGTFSPYSPKQNHHTPGKASSGLERICLRYKSNFHQTLQFQ